MKLYLIRHGQTDWNFKGKIQGNTDIELNEAGLWQADCLAHGMDNRPVKQIFSSNLKRAIATAAGIGCRQGKEVTVVDGLQEMCFGKWESLTWNEVKEQYEKEFQAWNLNPMEVAAPEGETHLELIQRSAAVITQIINQAEGDVAIVTHGIVIADLLAYLLRNHPEEIPDVVGNASITTLNYNPLTEDFLLMDANDTSHLVEKI